MSTYNNYIGVGNFFFPRAFPLLRGQLDTPVPVAVILKSGIVGNSYSETITVQNGTAPYVFSVSSGSLPTGTSLNSSTGVISGTTSAAATYTFTIQVVDANGNIGSQNFQITVDTRPHINYGFTS